jgi:hypothetical protein
VRPPSSPRTVEGTTFSETNLEDLRADARPSKAHSGSYLFGPKDVPHAFTVDSGPARLLFDFSPAGMQGLVREMGEPARSLGIPPQPEEPPGEAEMERMATIVARYGVEILGEPPKE